MGKHLSFEVEDFSIQPYENDDRLIELKEIKLMHSLLNANKSYISDDTLKRCLTESITNNVLTTPILAGFSDEFEYIKGHENSEICVGGIPNMEVEYRKELDGRNFAYVKGYIFKYYSFNLTDILEKFKTNSVKVSVEIEVKKSKRNRQKGYMEILDFNLLGLTLLGYSNDENYKNGNLIQEGMTGAKASFGSMNDKDLERLEQINKIVSNNLVVEEKQVPEQINKKEGVEDMIFNKKEFVEQFGLSTRQMDMEFAKACHSCKYSEKSEFGDMEYTKYFYEYDYDGESVYAFDSEKGCPVNIPFSMKGDNSTLDFENAYRVKYTRSKFEDGEEPEEDDDEDKEEDMYSLKSIEKSKFESESKVKELESKIAEFEAIPVIEDKTVEVDRLQVEVDKFSKDLEDAKQVAIDLGLKFDEITKEKEIVDGELVSIKDTVSKYEIAEQIAKVECLKALAKESFNKVADKFSKEEIDELGNSIEEIDSQEKFNAFEVKMKDLVFARFTAMSTKVEGAKFSRMSVNNEVDKEPVVVKTYNTVFEKWQDEKKIIK